MPNTQEIASILYYLDKVLEVLLSKGLQDFRTVLPTEDGTQWSITIERKAGPYG